MTRIKCPSEDWDTYYAQCEDSVSPLSELDPCDVAAAVERARKRAENEMFTAMAIGDLPDGAVLFGAAVVAELERLCASPTSQA